MKFLKAFFRVIVGAIFGLVAALALSPALAAIFPVKEDASGSGISILVLIVAGALLGFFAPTIRRAFGRGFLLAGVCLLALPISAFMLSGRAAHEVVSGAAEADQAAAAVGAGLAGVAMTGLATFFGLIVGGIFIIIGLVLALGGRREVIVIERHNPGA